MDFIIEKLYLLPGILLGFSFHEYAHARAAVWLGDDTPKHQGRLSLNPIVHIDIVGFILIIIAGFGWAKPVQINPNNFKNKKRDDMIVSAAGPLMNLVIALLFAILIKLVNQIPESMLSYNIYVIILGLLRYTIWINVVLFVFNLLPIPPLDGHHIFFGALNLKDTDIYYKFLRISRFLLLGLIITNLLEKIIFPPIIFIYENIMDIFF